MELRKKQPNLRAILYQKYTEFYFTTTRYLLYFSIIATPFPRALLRNPEAMTFDLGPEISSFFGVGIFIPPAFLPRKKLGKRAGGITFITGGIISLHKF